MKSTLREMGAMSTGIKYRRLKFWGLRLFAASMMLLSLRELYLASFEGIIDAPIGPIHSFVYVPFHAHPFWFCFGVAMNLFGVFIFGVLLWIAFWGPSSLERNINKKYPMRNY
jgi:hypothetical protein